MAGYSDTKDDVLKRLRRIEGQVRGLQRMVDEDVYCIDVLTQVSATPRVPCRAWPSSCSTPTCGTASPTPRDPTTRPRPSVSSAKQARAIERLVRS